MVHRIASFACRSEGIADPGAVAESFYAAYFTLSAGGVPDPAGRTRLAPFLTPRLNQLLEEAAAAEARYAEATKGEVPPLVEGDIFSSLFEGATALVGKPACNWNGNAGTCVAELMRMDSTGTSHWKDTLHLESIDGAWLIDDVEYGGDWPFGNKGRLGELLRAFIEEAKQPIEP